MPPADRDSGQALELPRLEAAVAYLRTQEDPFTKLGVALQLDHAPHAAVGRMRKAVADAPLLATPSPRSGLMEVALGAQ